MNSEEGMSTLGPETFWIATETNQAGVYNPDDRIGKPFLVMGQNLRKCLVYEQFFTRQAAPAHARVVCLPKKT